MCDLSYSTFTPFDLNRALIDPRPTLTRLSGRPAVLIPSTPSRAPVRYTQPSPTGACVVLTTQRPPVPPAHLLDDERHRVALVHEAQLALGRVGGGRVHEDAAVLEGPVHVGYHGADVAAAVRLLPHTDTQEHQTVSRDTHRLVRITARHRTEVVLIIFPTEDIPNVVT